MCGIVGVVGRDDAVEVLLDGLQRLEYRGYDSAGLCLIVPGADFWRIRASGKVSGLFGKTAVKPASTAGIAHTRWATHGVANECNAHPHKAGRVCLVHNGIIENYRSLKEEVLGAGRSFESDTDTEVIAHLLDMAIEAGEEPLDAMRSVTKRLRGAFALAVAIEGETERLLGARQGAPLLVGMGPDSGYLGSDVLALPDDANSITYLDDGDVVEVRQDGYTILDSTGRPANRPPTPLSGSHTRVDKGLHRHFTEKEIFEQPEVIGHTLARYIDAVNGTARLPVDIDFRNIKRLLIIGCGTTAFAGQIAKYWFEEFAGLPVEVDIASEFRYRCPAFTGGEAVLCISQSGETADTLEAMRMCKAAGLSTIALLNNEHSTMAREADIVLPTLAGPEIGVASTKAFTCQISVLATLAVCAGVQRDRLSEESATVRYEELTTIPRLVSQALKLRDRVDPLALELAQSRIVLYLGRNALFPLALEGALKLKELSYIHAEGYASGELKHGPIALIEEGVAVVVFAPYDRLFDKTRSSIEQVRARGGRVIAITDPAGADALGELADVLIPLPEVPSFVVPIVAAIAVQLIAYLTAVHKGTDVDQPRNLAKSVTVE